MPRGWFVYNGIGSFTATGNYIYITYNFESAGTGTLDVIYSYYSSGPPILGITHLNAFSPRIQGYLNAASVATQPLPLGIGRKKYVYPRPDS